jgi:hypothetical protein
MPQINCIMADSKALIHGGVHMDIIETKPRGEFNNQTYYTLVILVMVVKTWSVKTCLNVHHCYHSAITRPGVCIQSNRAQFSFLLNLPPNNPV